MPRAAAAGVARHRRVLRGAAAHPHFSSQVEGTVAQLVVEVGMDSADVAALLLEDPSFLARAPTLAQELGALNRLLHSLFGLYPRSARWAREAWRTLLREHPAVLRITPRRAAAVLRWWARLAGAAGWDEAATARYVDRALRQRPGLVGAGDWHTRRKVRALCALCRVPDHECAEFALRVMEAQAAGLAKFRTAAELEAALRREVPRFRRRAAGSRDEDEDKDETEGDTEDVDAEVAARLRRVLVRWTGALAACELPPGGRRRRGNVVPAGGVAGAPNKACCDVP